MSRKDNSYDQSQTNVEKENIDYNDKYNHPCIIILGDVWLRRENGGEQSNLKFIFYFYYLIAQNI